MTDHIYGSSTDVASEEKAPEVSAISRRNFFGLGVAAAGALVVGTSAMSASPAQADILRSVKGLFYLDPLVMNFAFEMEDLLQDFFTRAAVSDAYEKLSPREQSAISLIAREDREHYDALKKLRSKTGNKGAGHLETPNAANTLRPGFFRFPGNAFKTRAGMMETALDIKETALFAYHGAVDLVAKDTLMLAVAIAGVEGRHLAVLRELNGLDPFPSPFEGSMQSGAAGKRLSKYGFNGGGYGNKGGNR